MPDYRLDKQLQNSSWLSFQKHSSVYPKAPKMSRVRTPTLQSSVNVLSGVILHTRVVLLRARNGAFKEDVLLDCNSAVSEEILSKEDKAFFGKRSQKVKGPF